MGERGSRLTLLCTPTAIAVIAITTAIRAAVRTVA
jgi:hypothetical protein